MTPAEAIELIKKVAFSVENEIEEIKASKFITALKTAISALEKQIPKKVMQEKLTETLKPNCCPVCNHRHYEVSVPYCRFCGQALDWSDAE